MRTYTSFKNPVVNALSALIYIIFVVLIMNFVSRTLGNKPDTAFAPIVFLSLFTLSAAVMAYLFFYQPLVSLVEGRKKEAVNLFVQTVGVFGAITVTLLTFLLLRLV